MNPNITHRVYNERTYRLAGEIQERRVVYFVLFYIAVFLPKLPSSSDHACDSAVYVYKRRNAY